MVLKKKESEMSVVFNTKNSASLMLFIFEGKILSEADLTKANEALSSNKNWQIAFDLSQLTHTNSSGLAFMVKTLTKARINQGDVVLLNPNTGLNKLFEITKMQEVFSIVDSIAAAENYFKN